MVLAEKILVPENESYSVGEQIYYRPKSQPLLKRTWVIIGLLFVAMIVCNMIIQALVIQRDQQLTHLRKMAELKEQKVIKLRLEMAQLDSFDRIRHIAQNELGMRDAGSQDYLLIKGAPSLEKGNPGTGELAQLSSEKTGFRNKLSSWLGGIGRTMAKTP